MTPAAGWIEVLRSAAIFIGCVIFTLLLFTVMARVVTGLWIWPFSRPTTHKRDRL